MRFLLLLLICADLAQPQSTEEVYRVYTEHPRLFLRPQRLKLLKRERERQSMRWRQFDSLIAGNAAMPEPGFALALHYAVSGSLGSAKRAIEWALGPGSDLRELAIVYDWCQEALSEAQSKALAAKIQKALAAAPKPDSILAQRTRALAAIAIAEKNQDGAEAILRDIAGKWWSATLAPKLNSGANLDPGSELQALLELLHAVRDNLNIDLRPTAAPYFKTLPAFEVTCNYPGPLASAENEFRIPVFNGAGEPDLTRSALARAAGLSTVAYDSNALENQFLQGWLIQDRFMLRGAFGSPYEFLWANPYQPGLAYVHLPLIFHDERSGMLFLRSDWEEDAVWFAMYEGQAQLYRQGQITVLNLKLSSGKQPAPVQIGKASVVLASNPARFKATGDQMFVIGGKPRTKYDVEVDGEELRELESDAAGTLSFTFAEDQIPGVRFKETAHGRN